MALQTIPYQRPDTMVQANIVRNAFNDVLREQNQRSAIIQAAQRNNQENMRRMDTAVRSMQKMVSDRQAREYQQEKDEFLAGMQIRAADLAEAKFNAQQNRYARSDRRDAALDPQRRALLEAQTGYYNRRGLPETGAPTTFGATIGSEPGAPETIGGSLPRSAILAAESARADGAPGAGDATVSPEAIRERERSVAGGFARAAATPGGWTPAHSRAWAGLSPEQKNALYGSVTSWAKSLNKGLTEGSLNRMFPMPDPADAPEPRQVSVVEVEQRVIEGLTGRRGTLGRIFDEDDMAAWEGDKTLPRPTPTGYELNAKGRSKARKILLEVAREYEEAGTPVDPDVLDAALDNIFAPDFTTPRDLGIDGPPPTAAERAASLE